MTIEGALLARLTGYAGLTALVSTRVYGVRLPQNVTLPAVSFFRVSADREHAMGARAKPTHARFQVSAWAVTYDAMRAVAAQVVAALDRYSGTLDSTVIQQIFVDTDSDLHEAGIKDAGVFHRPTDFLVHYEE